MDELAKQEWVILVLDAATSKILQPVQLQKSLFLLTKSPSMKRCPPYGFRPFHYGPFDADIYADAETLASKGLVCIDTNSFGGWKEYALTQKGAQEATALWSKLEPSEADNLRQIVQWTQGQTFDQLVKAIYRRFPEYRVNSVFQGADEA